MTKTRISGIYSITNLKTGWRYIGSSEDVQDRLLRHRGKLEAGLHYLRRLQNDWGKYGRSAFDF
jgi:predicted GIY-YIG superfamily endonuclease